MLTRVETRATANHFDGYRKMPTVEVVIPSTNGLTRGLRDCISSLRNQDHPPKRFIIVDSGSTDGTLEWLQHQPDVVVIRGTTVENFSHSRVRNLGAAATVSDLVLLTCDDVVFQDKTWLRRATESLLDCDLSAISGIQRPAKAFNRLSLFGQAVQVAYQARLLTWRLRTLNKKHEPSTIERISRPRANLLPVFLDHTNCLYRKSVLEGCAFRLDSMEDIAATMDLTRLGFKLGFSRNLKVRHSQDLGILSVNELFTRQLRDSINSSLAITTLIPNKERLDRQLKEKTFLGAVARYKAPPWLVSQFLKANKLDMKQGSLVKIFAAVLARKTARELLKWLCKPDF